jgi:tRNA (cmo5U34)-methyltransferase
MSTDVETLFNVEEMGEFFNRRADGYEAHMAEIGFDGETYKRAVMPLPQSDKPFKILDLGCGTGLELQYLFERIPNAQVTCIDLSEQMLALLAEHYQDHKLQLEIICDSYLTWDYPNAAYDDVISVNTMHHLVRDEKVRLYRKIRRCLKAAGMYVESDFMVDKIMMEQYQARYKRINSGLSIPQQSGYYHIDIPFTVDVQNELLLKAGFGEVSVFHENIKPKGSAAVLTAKVDCPDGKKKL